MKHCCLKKCLWNLRGDHLSCLNSNCLGQILLIMLSVSIDPINGAVPVTARQGNALLPLLKLQWVCYGVSYIQKEKTCRYVHTHLFMTMQCVCVCVCVCVCGLRNIVITCVCRKCLFPICSLSFCHCFLLCSPFAIWTLSFISSKCFWSVKFPAIHRR